jgi:hypothetical protein
MAFCLAQVKHPEKSIKIVKWQLINIDLGNIERTSALCVALMGRLFVQSQSHPLKNNKNTWVIVERQMPTNFNCLSLSYVIWTYFMTKFSNINVSFVSATSKPITSTGRKRKRDSVITAQDILKANDVGEWVTWLQKQTKKDDLTDAYLQIVGNIDKIVYNHEEHNNENVVDLTMS